MQCSSAAMAGLVKAKKYDWKDSNLALFGSDTDRKVKRVRDLYPPRSILA